MSHESFTPQHRAIGIISTLSVSILLVAYAITTILGFLSLKSPMDPIGNPYFTIMELLIILIALLLTISMIAVHAYASSEVKVYSLIALVFMIILTGITSSVHFVILSVSHPIEASGLTCAPFLFSFKWPSVVYALDILAWDWFFAISMLFAAPVFKGNRLETAVRVFMFISGILSLAGLIGVPLANMQVRNIGIIGYALVSIVVFILLGIVFGRTGCVNGDPE
ncbi:MAG: hypothetical protein CVV49_05365 [Spirochaetae bacterium HGW-Spirochaetae-5]|nr:MAG: hypothetical protein CVV49_05365 [Spirochaetae bacterium HGW-Spirochaetae-5]